MSDEKDSEVVDALQIKAENKALKELLNQQKSTIEKHEGLISTLRKVESRSQRTETIVKDAVAAMRQGIPDNFLKIAETLPLETQWAMYKAFPRPDLAPPSAPDPAPAPDVPAATTSISAAPFMLQQSAPVAPVVKQSASPRPVTPQIESPLEREKAQLKAAGTLNMHTMLELIRKHNSI